MKKNRKKIPFFMSIAIALSLILSINASAFPAIWDQPWGPRWYTPYDGVARASNTSWRGDNLKWSLASIGQLDMQMGYWELEARNGNPSNVWGSTVGSISNLPGFYVDNPDPDDRAFGTHSNFFNLVADAAYYGQINFNSVSTYTGNYITVESEVGQWFIWDGLPDRYEQLTSQIFCVSGGTTSLPW